jgi:hypothetical protein
VNRAESVPRGARRRAAWGGVVGPITFLGAWVVGGAVTTAHYSPVHDPISRLAAIGADTRGLMSAGFVGFGLGVPLYGATGLATLGVAAAPLGRSATGDTWHGVFALAGYLSLASTPLLAAPSLVRMGQRTLASVGVASSAVTAFALVLATTTAQRGLFQRVGLTSTHLWIVASALTILRSAADPSST